MGLFDFLFGSGDSDGSQKKSSDKSFDWSENPHSKRYWNPPVKADPKHGPDKEVNRDAPRPKHGIDW